MPQLLDQANDGGRRESRVGKQHGARNRQQDGEPGEARFEREQDGTCEERHGKRGDDQVLVIGAHQGALQHGYGDNKTA